jgi:hypothetical protein
VQRATSARPGAAWARAELDLDAAHLRAARFYAPSGKQVRAATWTWDGAALRALDVVDGTTGATSRVDLSAPRCVAAPLVVTPETLLPTALALAAE